MSTMSEKTHSKVQTNSAQKPPKSAPCKVSGWKNIPTVLPTITMVAGNGVGGCWGKWWKRTYSLLLGSGQGLPRTSTLRLPENSILPKIWVIWWQSAQPAHFEGPCYQSQGNLWSLIICFSSCQSQREILQFWEKILGPNDGDFFVSLKNRHQQTSSIKVKE